ncbi:hypothetical protein [Streptomyces himalayensis]|jgi:hypothetical protein|uniref:Metallothionein n=2 Tax=Streptomyces himalayensis TaxID=2820085 RepID=A0A7W2HJ83_9ACTN|nr:hypothetical protein [Streptomyces himalayensis]MBA2947256.1 hypothetical protein [Streptomyces himalayensis subsp. himalayensis]MBA4865847.1 hypothetical protein [Streptomyces himalayensis subsp. aureolus]
MAESPKPDYTPEPPAELSPVPDLPKLVLIGACGCGAGCGCGCQSGAPCRCGG